MIYNPNITLDMRKTLINWPYSTDEQIKFNEALEKPFINLP